MPLMSGRKSSGKLSSISQKHSKLRHGCGRVAWMPQPSVVQCRHHAPVDLAISGTAKCKQQTVQGPQTRRVVTRLLIAMIPRSLLTRRKMRQYAFCQAMATAEWCAGLGEARMLQLKFLVSAIVALAACLGVASARAETVLRSIPLLDVKILDPYVNTNYGTRNHGHMIYETLFAWDSKLQPKPMMVDTWTVSDDRLVWRFHLRDGLKWHDGKPVTSADVLASLDRYFKKDVFGAKLADATASLKADDERSFTLTLKRPFGLVLEALGRPSGQPPFIEPERFARLPDGSPDFKPIGSGPFVFKLDEWQPGIKNVYLKNKDYVPRAEPPDGFAGGHVVKVDRVEWLTMPDSNTAANALMAGEVDLYELTPWDQIPQLEADKDITVTPTDALGSQYYIRPNQLFPPFDNLKARQALLYIVDQDQEGLVVTGEKRFYTVCGAYLMCGSPLASDAGAVKPNLAMAKQLLKEAGYNGEKIVMLDPTNTPQFDAPSQLTAELLRKAGLNIDLQAVDYNMMISRRAKRDPPDKGGWNLYLSGNSGIDVASPMTNMYLASNCERAAPGWPCDKVMEDLKDDFAKATSDDARKTIAEKIQLRAVAAVPYLPAVQVRNMVAYRKVLSGVLPSPVPLYWNIEKHG
jgi:peptide/nickel transport system substrate-binding protein